MSETNDEIVITAEMANAGGNATYSVGSIYRAMAKVDPARQSSFTPTDDDIWSLAAAIYANASGITFAHGKERLRSVSVVERDHWYNMAQAAFEHPGYLPSIKAARQDAMSAYKYESDKYREEIAAWKDRYAILQDQLQSALSEVRPVIPVACNMHGPYSGLVCPLCSDDVKFKGELRWEPAPEHLTLDQQYRLVEVAFLTDSPQIRRAALDVLVRAFNPEIVVP